jgi:hypothetical protein
VGLLKASVGMMLPAIKQNTISGCIMSSFMFGIESSIWQEQKRGQLLHFECFLLCTKYQFNK